MTERKNLDAEVEAYAQRSKEWLHEHERIKRTPEFKRSQADLARQIEAQPLIGRVINTALYVNSPSSHKRDAEAVGVLVDRLERLLQSESAIKASHGATSALREVIESLSAVHPLLAGYSSIVEAFAAPAAAMRAPKTKKAIEAKMEQAKAPSIKKYIAEQESRGVNMFDTHIAGQMARKFGVSPSYIRIVRSEYLAERGKKSATNVR